MSKDQTNHYRSFLKDTVRKTIDFRQTDQNLGLPPPPLEKPYSKEKKRIDLVSGEDCKISDIRLVTAIRNRRSHRHFQADPLTVEELSFLLWSTQGIQQIISEGTALRTVPSAGCRHAFETYLFILNVEGLDAGVYRYLPVERQLLFEFAVEQLPERLVRATFDQSFIARAAVTFVWTAIPYRMEWRYGRAAHRVIALDAGHVCQNLYLACSVIGAGTCAIGAYDQDGMDELLKVDGEDEFTLYMAPVGKV